MKSHRYRGLGLFLTTLMAGGCHGPTKPPTTTAPAVESNSQPADDARWKVDATLPETPEQALARRTAEYAGQLQDGTTPDLMPSDPSPQARFPGRVHRKIATIPLDDQVTAPPAPPPPIRMPQAPPVASTPPVAATAQPPQTQAPTAAEDPNQSAHVAALKQAADVLNDGPRTVPESADFATAKPVSSSAIEPLEYRLHKRARDNPHDIAAQLDLELYAMLKDEPAPELAAVTLLPHQDRELISTLIDGLSDFRSAVREDETMLQAKKIRPLMDMVERLRSQADLAVPTVALCTRVEGFGKYDAINPARFPAGRESKVIVYCEVENFESKKLDTQWWETRLTQQVTIYTDAGQFVWADRARAIADQSHRRRHDFYAYELLRLPADLTIGRYLLKVTITDENAGKVAEETVPVSIGALEANADR